MPASFCVHNKSSYTETKVFLQQTVHAIWSMCRDFCNFTVLLAKCPCPGYVTWIPLNWQFTNKATLLVPDSRHHKVYSRTSSCVTYLKHGVTKLEHHVQWPTASVVHTCTWKFSRKVKMLRPTDATTVKSHACSWRWHNRFLPNNV